ncbi:hypothetical protein [Nocardia fusca]|uniref:hypothetical protein n=1 Tax=Nocardia fusca TaxID=941183 RepID=UPI0007A73AD7|nr:hypothetical protein [Nocardia fusca]
MPDPSEDALKEIAETEASIDRLVFTDEPVPDELVRPQITRENAEDLRRQVGEWRRVQAEKQDDSDG